MSSPEEPSDGQLEPLSPAESDEVEPTEVVGQQMALPLEVRHHQSLHMGPLPDPRQLAAYDEVLPGLANRIVEMAELEQQHRHGLERVELTQPYNLAQRGQAFGLILAVLVLAFGCLLIVTGSPILGAGVVGLDLVALVAVFVTGRSSNEGGGQQSPPAEPDTQPPSDGPEQPGITGN